MTTVYVSNSATNGFASGSDAATYAQAQNKSTPWLTLTKAVGSCTAGDAIVLNDGAYSEASSVNIGKIVNLQPYSDFGCAIKSASGTTRVLHFLTASGGSTIGKIVVDAQGNQQSCITCDTSSNVSSLTITGTLLKNPTQYFLMNTQKLQALTMSGAWEMRGASALGGIWATPGVSGAWSIKDGSINLIANSKTCRLIQLVPTVSGVTLDCSGIIFNIANSSSVDVSGLFVQGVVSVDIHDIVCNYTGSRPGIIGGAVEIYSNATITCTHVDIHSVSGDLGGSKYSILVGDDAAPSTRDNINGVSVYRNNLKNSNHGYIFSYISNAKAYRNYIENCVIGFIGKATSGCLFYSNVVNKTGKGGGLRSKGGADFFYGNTIIMGGDASATGILTTKLDVSPDTLSGSIFKNNIILGSSSSQVLAKIGNSSDASTDSLDTNNYWGSDAANSYLYHDVAYATLAAWFATGRDTHSIYTDPVIGGVFIGDYSPRAGSTKTSGENLTSSGATTDYNGKARPAVGPWCIGAVQRDVQSGYGAEPFGQEPFMGAFIK